MNRRQYVNRRRDCNDPATSQRMLTASRGWKGQWMFSPLETPEETGPADTLTSASLDSF